MTDGNDFSGIGHDRVGIKVRLDTLGLHADLAAQLLARTVIEIDDSAPVMRMCLMPKVEQVFDHIVWNPALLQPCLRVMGHRQHDSSPIRGQWNERYRAGGSPDAPVAPFRQPAMLSGLVECRQMDLRRETRRKYPNHGCRREHLNRRR